LNASLEVSPVLTHLFVLFLPCFFVGHLMEFGSYSQNKPIHSETQLVMAMAGGSDV
jgi:hypothetical protein